MNISTYIISVMNCQCVFKFDSEISPYKYGEINILIKLLIYSMLTNYNTTTLIHATCIVMLSLYLILNITMAYITKDIVENKLTLDKITLLQMLLLLSNSIYFIACIVPFLLKLGAVNLNFSITAFYTTLLIILILLSYFSKIHDNIINLLKYFIEGDIHVKSK